ncbi:L,D-transpeptidase family protein [Teredinibacter sp. KSP-S5-2]|uniref:L,D-transpeptidase family protein n=1 Tax=Teredinibacter sp. KSP-S5-2 TaxID=3034506 RepID=UPI0029352F67|nr:L,D-transpeptidase family protein [Teredinibacter sp. KSP-S5-2]WNO09170.1 hypothetical protein P5V12_19700 [Teredinibacter sp. KSP-S5-2]
MYEITVERGISQGTLTFTGPNKSVQTKCYWNLSKKIPAGVYTGCSATTMARKKNSAGKPREAVFIPNVVGFSGIFIHMGKPPYEKWSDGCVVIEETKIIEIYNAITPKDGRNVKVTITDKS